MDVRWPYCKANTCFSIFIVGRRVGGCKWMHCFGIEVPPRRVGSEINAVDSASGRGNRTRQIWCQWWRGQQILKPSLIVLAFILWYCQGAARPKHRARQEKSKLEPYQTTSILWATGITFRDLTIIVSSLACVQEENDFLFHFWRFKYFNQSEFKVE